MTSTHALRRPSFLQLGALLAGLVASTSPAAAQQLRGQIVDDSTGLLLDLVSVELMDAARAQRGSTVSDSAGGFSIWAPVPGEYTLRLSRIGYADIETGTVTVAAGEQLELELRMSISAVPLEPLIVTGRSAFRSGRLRDYYQRATLSQRMGRGRVFMRDDLARMNLPQPSAVLINAPSRGGCRPVILLDGLPVNSARELDSIVFTDALEGIEIYTGPSQIPQEYAHRGYCAVALFWTRHDVEHARPLSWRRVLLAAGIVITGAVLLH
jgi:hypothetical protein